MQAQALEAERDERLDRRAHQALAGERLTDPIAEAARLGDAAAHIGDGEAAPQRMDGTAKQEERIAHVGPQVLGIALQAATEGTTRQIVGEPGRLPRREEVAARLAQRRPFGEVRHLRRPQEHALSLDDGKRLGKRNRAEEGHGPGTTDDGARRQTMPRRSLLLLSSVVGPPSLSHAARWHRLSAIVAALSSPRLGPSAATAGRLREISARPAVRALSTVTASTLATISSSGMGRP